MKTLKAGDKAPPFEAYDEKGNLIKLSDLKGKKVLIYFYPKDNTPTCTVEACNFRDNYKDFVNKDIIILGVSPDSAKKHQNFINKFELPFPLLVDKDLKLAKSFGVWGEKKFMGRIYDGIHRFTFLIDEKGVIENVITKVISKEASRQIFDYLNDL